MNRGVKQKNDKITLTAGDGYKLSATRFNAVTDEKARIVVAGATGVHQKYYSRFAEYARKRGFSTLTFDYRGIGESRPETLKGFNASYLDWAQLDLAAAVDEMKHESLPLFIAGHSFGGHAFGLLPNHHHVKKFYVFATGSGWAGWMPRFERVRVLILWHLILPIIVKIKGFMAWSWLGMGEDLPLNVYRQWKYWCRYPHYFFDDPAMKETVACYQNIRTPIKAANSLDDVWATPESRDAFISGYSNAPIETWDIDLMDQLGHIGHMGYFKPFATPLWDDMLQWFMQIEAV